MFPAVLLPEAAAFAREHMLAAVGETEEVDPNLRAVRAEIERIRGSRRA
ncbi:hypothetical protein [Streptoalloteichus tenebrarius]